MANTDFQQWLVVGIIHLALLTAVPVVV